MTSLYEIFRRCDGVSTDSRRVGHNTLFFALRGASFDGNRFAADAIRSGAAFAVVDDPSVRDAHPELSGRIVAVDDTLATLQELAREHRRTLGIPLLALSGSNGKTTTKELLRLVLASKYSVQATEGNLNNHIGVPLTLLALKPDTEFAVVEMGASACGEIALLCSIAQPDYGLLTNVGRAHLEGFGGPEGVRRGKGELFDYLASAGGCAFIPREDEVLAGMAAERPGLRVESYSVAAADRMEHRLEGSYNLRNIAAAAAVGRHFGISDAAIRSAVASYVPDNNRSQRVETRRNTLIVDCYNANPSSMRASVGHFLSEPAAERSCKFLILGDMLELGAWSACEHRAILDLALSEPTAAVLLVGPEFAAAARSLAAQPEHLRLFPNCRELTDHLAAHAPHDALILIKGSRGIGLERCIDAL